MKTVHGNAQMISRWSQLLGLIALINVVAVGFSVIQRALATAENKLLPPVPSQSQPDVSPASQASWENARSQSAADNRLDTASSPTTATLEKRLQNIAPPSLIEQAAPVPNDDPLMKEMLQQFGHRFPQYSNLSTSAVQADKATEKSRKKLLEVQRLVKMLDDLSDLEDQFVAAGKSSEAEGTQQQMQIIEQSIVELLLP